MKLNKLGAAALLAVSATFAASSAHAICTNNWADVTITCPNPVPFTGPKKLTPTSQNLPTVGTPGVYQNQGNGYSVRVFLYKNGTGFQPFPWQQRQ